MAPIYTKSGDAGQTGLFGGGRVPKDDDRVDAYGEVDELNAVMGLVLTEALDEELKALAVAIQHQLFTVGAVLATPKDSRAAAAIPKVDPAWALAMEAAIDKLDLELPPLSQFILPGG